MAGPRARARSAAGDRRVRRVVRRHAVLRVELRRTRAHRHHELAHLHRRHGASVLKLWKPKTHHAARGRSAASSTRAEAASGRRALRWRGCRTCCSSRSCSSWGDATIKPKINHVARRASSPPRCRPCPRTAAQRDRLMVPGLHNHDHADAAGAPKQPAPYAALYELNWLSASGHGVLPGHDRGRAAACASGRSRFVGPLRGDVQAVVDWRWRRSRRCSASRYLMNYSGMTSTLGLALAAHRRLRFRSSARSSAGWACS